MRLFIGQEFKRNDELLQVVHFDYFQQIIICEVKGSAEIKLLDLDREEVEKCLKEGLYAL